VPVNLALGKVTVSGGDVQYAGGAPTLLCGVAQINLEVPMRATPGRVYTIDDAKLLVEVTRIRHQRQVYER
jgi:uncharacterized protein (TIGR03437 family)